MKTKMRRVRKRHEGRLCRRERSVVKRWDWENSKEKRDREKRSDTGVI